MLRTIKLATRVAPATHYLLNFRNQSSFGWLSTGGRQSEQVITLKIKQTKKSDQLQQIISKHGATLNIVHISAILDRMQQQQMINVQPLVDFAIDRLKIETDMFYQFTRDQVRTICNIICYIGNTKRKDLNDIFKKVNYQLCLRQAKNVEVTMLITGLLRLELFSEVFTFEESSEDSRIRFVEVFGKDLTAQQISSIWFAFLTHKIQLISQIYAQIIDHLVNAPISHVKSQQAMPLVAYAYGVICLSKTLSKLQEQAKGKLIKWFEGVVILSTRQALLRSYQLSQFLYSLKHLKKSNLYPKIIRQSNKEPISFLVQRSFLHMCRRASLTLRQLANCYIAIEETTGASGQTRQEVVHRLGQICKWGEARLKKGESDSEKIDHLSLCSLVWKLGRNYTKYNKEELFLKSINQMAAYVIALNSLNQLKEIPNSHLIMLYDGLGMLAGRGLRITDQSFITTSVERVTDPAREWSVKEKTFFLTYFKYMRFTHPAFCKWVASSFSKQDPLWRSCKAARHLIDGPEGTCVMGHSALQCLGCLASPQTAQQL